MSTFSVTVRTQNGGEDKFEEQGISLCQVSEDVSDRYGNLCAVMVIAK